MKTNMLAVAAFVAMTAGAAKAQENNWPCKTDADKFCKGVEPGGGRILACLKQHQADLSAECKAKGLQRKVETDPAAEPCRTDLDKFCPDVKGGPAEKIRCLKEHEKDLSESCETKLQTIPKKDPCKTDMARFCNGIKPGGGRLTSLNPATHEAAHKRAEFPV